MYNPANGELMKTCVDDVHETVVALQYICSTRRFVAGYANGIMRVYDEGALGNFILQKVSQSLTMCSSILQTTVLFFARLTNLTDTLSY